MSYRHRFESAFADIGSWLFRHPFLPLAAAAGLLVATTSQLPKLRFESSVMSMFHEEDPARVANEMFQEQFGKDDVFLVALEPKDLFERRFIESLVQIHRDIERKVPFVEEVTSLVNVRHTRGEGDQLLVAELLDPVPDTAEGLARLRERVLESPLYRNFLVSEDGTLTAVVVRPQVSRQEDGRTLPVDTPEYTEMYRAIREITEPYREQGIQIHYAGHPVIAVVLQDAMERDMGMLIPLSMLLIVVLLAVAFRRLTGVIFPLAVVVFALLSTLGVMAALDLPLTSVTTVLPSFLIVVGIADSVHLLAIFYRRYQDGRSKHDALSYAFGHAGLAILLTSFTTAAGLLSFLTAEVAWVADFGAAVPIGVLFAFLYTVLLVPALVALFPMARGRATSRNGSPWSDRVLCAVGDFAVQRRWWVVGAWALVATFAAVGFSWTRLSQNSLEWYPDGHPIRTATQAIDGSMNGSLTVEVLLDTGEENGLYDAGLISGLDEIAAELQRDSGGPVAYGKVMSVATVLKEVNQALHGNRAEFYRVPDTDQLVAQELLLFEMSGSDDLEDQVSTDMRMARMSLSVPFADANEYVPLFDGLTTRLRQAFPDHTVTVTGMVAMFIRSMWNILISMARSYPTAFGVITLLMILLVGRLRVGLLSMVPNLVPIAIVVGAMGWLDLPFDVSTMLIGSVAIGLVVDDTIHFLHTFAREFDAAGDVRLAVQATLVTTGRAIVATSLTLAGGFLVYAAATLRTLLHFGLLTAAIVILAMLADFLLVPALLSILFGGRASSVNTGPSVSRN